MQFKEWLLLQETAHGTFAKQGLYPPAYSIACLYPPADVITWASDAITYMPEKDRRFKFIWGKGMLSNPQNEKE